MEVMGAASAGLGELARMVEGRGERADVSGVGELKREDAAMAAERLLVSLGRSVDGLSREREGVDPAAHESLLRVGRTSRMKDEGRLVPS